MKFLHKIFLIFFVSAFIIISIIPFAFMPFFPTERLSGGTEPVKFPNFVNDNNTININYLSDLGEYFEYHFAFRPQLVTANSLLRYMIFNDSGTDQVIYGKDGFMFYSGTLDDYFGKNNMTDLQLKIIAENLSLIQKHLESNGKKFCFVVAPNKNTLYPQFMPHNLIESKKPHNFETLIKYLDINHVNYLNLFDTFNNIDSVLYLKEDSHWSNRGALIASNDILWYFNKEELSNIKWQDRFDRDGDLYIMEYPSIVGKEEESYAIDYNDNDNLSGNNWKFTQGYSYEEDMLKTESKIPSGNDNLYTYRDSFANALIPYLSSAYNNSYYSKLLPYDIQASIDNHVDDVVIERAERNLRTLSYIVPIMAAPLCGNDDFTNMMNNSTDLLSFSNTCNAFLDGDFLQINGEIDEKLISLFSEENLNIILKIDSSNSSKCYYSFKYIDRDSDKLNYCLRISDLNIDIDYNIELYIEHNGKIVSFNRYNINDFRK